MFRGLGRRTFGLVSNGKCAAGMEQEMMRMKCILIAGCKKNISDKLVSRRLEALKGWRFGA